MSLIQRTLSAGVGALALVLAIPVRLDTIARAKPSASPGTQDHALLIGLCGCQLGPNLDYKDLITAFSSTHGIVPSSMGASSSFPLSSSCTGLVTSVRDQMTALPCTVGALEGGSEFPFFRFVCEGPAGTMAHVVGEVHRIVLTTTP